MDIIHSLKQFFSQIRSFFIISTYKLYEIRAFYALFLPQLENKNIKVVLVFLKIASLHIIKKLKGEKTMGRREQMQENAKKHTALMDRVYSKEIEKSIAETHLYGIDFVRDKMDGNKAVFVVEKSYTQDSITKNAGKEKIAVLNFASYRNAGGGFLNGSMAQEEALCHSSFLYNILRKFPKYYEWNEANYNKGLYKNRALYSPNVFFFFFFDRHYVIADVITCAAPNRSMLLKDGRFSEKENETVLKDRIRFIRDICDNEGVEVLIAGAFGCGVFAQKPETVARFFREVFSDTKVKKVIFAVPPDRNYPPFEREFRGR